MRDIHNLVERNLDALEKLQTEKKRNKRWDLHYIDPIVAVSGSMSFLWFNLAIFVIWILINIKVISFVKVFDPFPFEFLTLTVSLEAIFLSIVVLIGQNELQRDSDQRAELDLHINLLAERETTAILRKLDRLEKHLQIKVDKNESEMVEELLTEIDPINISQKISKSLVKPPA
jgi:uncharacterized membrane protein